MRALFVIFALGISAAGVNATTFQSFAPLGALVIAEPAQNGENGSAVTASLPSADSGSAPASPSTKPTTASPGATQPGSDPFDWLNVHLTPVAGFSGGSPYGGGSRGGGRYSGG